MDFLWWHPIHLGIVLFLGGSSGTSSHSLNILYTLMPELSPRLPQFVAQAYVDDQLIGSFDSNTERARPASQWMEKVEKDHPDFWKWVTDKAVNSERRFRDDLKFLQRNSNQSEEFHTWQRRHGCEVSDDGYRGGFFQYAYDGKEIISLDPENFTCTVADGKAEVLKRRWETNPVVMVRWRGFLEVECPAWLEAFVAYGKETLMRRAAPQVKVTLRTLGEKQEILTCEVHGFYPREMEATWRRDGEVWEHRTSRRSIAPNSDGTFYAWLSVDIDPTERSQFKCHVDHPSLREPLVLAWEEPESCHLWIIWEITAGLTMLAEVLLVLGFLFQKISNLRKIFWGTIISVIVIGVFLLVLILIKNNSCQERIIWKITIPVFACAQMFWFALWIHYLQKMKTWRSAGEAQQWQKTHKWKKTQEWEEEDQKREVEGGEPELRREEEALRPVAADEDLAVLAPQQRSGATAPWP